MYKVTAPIALALIGAALLLIVLLIWSTARTDAVSIDRQEQLVSHVLHQHAAKIIKEQESVTLKDNYVRFFSKPITSKEDVERLNGNHGPFLHKYFGHDESYLLTKDDRAFYAMRDGQRVGPATFESLRTVAAPLLSELRAKTRAYGAKPVPDGSPGVYDIAIVNGRPAIISLKPIMSPTGKLPQVPGKELIHISVMRLDGKVLKTLADNYLFKGGRFAWQDDHRSHESAQPFVSPRTGKVLGYFIWQPFAPGSAVLHDIVPALILTLLLVAGIVWVLIRRIKRATAQLLASEAQAKHLAFHDTLTGLPNRALFEDRMDRALAATRRHSDQAIALLYLDLDRFKKVNDTLGHPAGDELIRELGRRLAATVRPTDTVARLGGDEFAIIQTNVRSDQDVETLCERLLAVVQDAFDVIGSQVFVGMSIGVARSGIDGSDRTELTRKADIALYHAKAGGRGRFAIFTEALDETIQNRQEIERDLRTALDKGDQLEVHYQPTYDAASGSIAGIEALVRWNHPTRGMACPSIFVPIAEECGLIERLGSWVLEEACKASKDWPIHTLSVNVSPVQLRDPLFPHRVVKILRETGMDPARLELEITETAFLENAEQCQPNLKLLRAAGIRIALDDFGTGYSSFSHLRHFEIDRLKIDRSFTAAIQSATEGGAIIQAIVDLARSTGLKITAEGVETAEQSTFLRSIGCDELQGFLMSRPISGDNIGTILKTVETLRRPSAKPVHAA